MNKSQSMLAIFGALALLGLLLVLNDSSSTTTLLFKSARSSAAASKTKTKEQENEEALENAFTQTTGDPTDLQDVLKRVEEMEAQRKKVNDTRPILPEDVQKNLQEAATIYKEREENVEKEKAEALNALKYGEAAAEKKRKTRSPPPHPAPLGKGKTGGKKPSSLEDPTQPQYENRAVETDPSSWLAPKP